jgi:hypothetical protein
MKLWTAMMWMAGTVAGMAAGGANPVDLAKDPRGQAALAYVEALRSGGELQGGISAETEKERRKDIASQWVLLRGLLADSGALQVEALGGDEQLAGVLVRAKRADQPTEVTMVAVALVQRNGGWQAAPLPGIFANAGLPFDADLRARAKKLEVWLAEQQVQRLDALQQAAAAEFTAAMERTVGRDILLESPAKEILQRFLEAAEKRDFAALMALCGGLQSPRPDDWDERLRSVTRCLRDADKPGKASAWTLLAQPEIVRLIFVEKDLPPYFGIGFYDPHRNQRGGMISEMFFQLDKVNGLWRVNLPDELMTAAPLAEGEEGGQAIWIGRGEDEEMPDWFSEAFERLNEPLFFKDPAALAEAVVQALEGGKFAELMRMLGREVPIPGERRAEYIALARFWQQLRPLGEAVLTEVAQVTPSGPVAAISFRGFSAARTEDLAIVEVLAVQSEKGWTLAVPGISPITGEKPAAAAKQLANDEPERRKQLTARGRDALLGSASPLTEVAAAAVDEALAMATVQAWRDAASAGALGEMLKRSSWLAGPGEQLAILRSLGSEAIAAAQSASHGEILATHRDGPWALVSMRVQRGSTVSFPAYVVVATPAGPRVLLTVDLESPVTRMAEFLNQAQWARLAKLLPESQLTSLRGLFAKHVEVCAPLAAAAPSPEGANPTPQPR